MLGNEGDREAQQRIEQAGQEGARELDLSGLELTELPEAIASLTQLRQLYLKNNPLNPDLAAAYEQGTEAVLQYLRERQKHKSH